MKNLFEFQEITKINVDYTELLEQVYFKNSYKKRIRLEASSITTTKELFKFCLDLFCKGLVLCHGDEYRQVKIDDLSMVQIQDVIDKLSYTGIMTIIQIFHNDYSETSDDNTQMALQESVQQTSYNVLSESVNQIDIYPDNDELKNYNFKIKVGPNIFCIYFDIRC